MKTKKLNGQQIESLKKLIIQGKLPSELKDMFDVSISTIHNYKREIKENGVELPNAKGKRPIIKNFAKNGLSHKDKVKVMEISIEKDRQDDYFLKIIIGENYYEMNITGILKVK